MVGEKFGKWTVLVEVEKKHTHRYYECLCECGAKQHVSSHNLKHRISSQCIRCARKATRKAFGIRSS